MPGGKHNQRGFTLIELIVVIILLGILSVTAASRMIGRSSFDAFVTRDQAISVARQIQITAMQSGNTNNSLNACDRLFVVYNEDDTKSHFGVPISVSCPDNREQSSAFLPGKNTHTQFSPSTEIYFNLLGRPVDASGSRICTSGSGCKVTIRSRNGETACLYINSEGFIHEGDCV